MATPAYEFKHNDGTNLGTVLSLESNGPDAASVPIQIKFIDFSTTPIQLVVDGDTTDRFPAAVINKAPATDYDIDYVEVAGEFDYSSQLKPGNAIILFNGVDDVVVELTISAANSAAGVTTIDVNETIPLATVNAWDNVYVSTVRSFDIIGGSYDGHYFVAEAGATIDGDGNTRIPVHESVPLASPAFEIVAVTSGAGGSFTIADAANGSCLFRVGSQFSVDGNTQSNMNANYLVSTVETSGSYNIAGVSTNEIVVIGDHRRFFVNNQKISVSGGQARDVRLTIASAVLDGSNTVITTVEPVPSSVTASGTVVCVPSMTNISVVGTVPTGAAANGNAIPAQPVAYSFSAPPAITPTTPHNFLITWRISGNQTSKFTPGCPVLIKGNSFYEYQEFPVQSVSFTGGMTHIVTQVSEPTNMTPTPNATGQLVYPAPAANNGFVQYTTDVPFSSLKLVGKGAPTYNENTTWGQALQDNMISLAENFASGLRTAIVGINTGTSGKFHISSVFKGHNQLIADNTIGYTGDSNQPAGSTDYYTIGSITHIDDELLITVQGTVSPSYAGDGELIVAGNAPIAAMVGQLWYDRASPQLYAVTGVTNINDVDSHGVVVQTVPALDYIDMGNQLITQLADAEQPQHAVNLRTSDLLYIAKTGGYSADPAIRSGSMTGSLNFGTKPAAADWSALGINTNNANVNLYGSAAINFDASSTGGVTVNGTGNVRVKQGHVQVGNGTSNFVTIQNNAGAAPTITFTTSTTGNEVLNVGSNKIVNVSTPTNPADAANKAYVDNLANGIVWLQPVLDPNLFADHLSAPPFISSSVVSVTTGASNTWKISGNHATSIAAGMILTITGNSFPAANKSYVVVSATNNGGNTDVVVTASTVPVGATNDGTAADTSVPTHKTYIVKAPGTGLWAGLDGRAVTYSVTSIDPVSQTQTWGWIDILGRAVQVGDRFGVFVEPDAEDPLNILPSGNLASASGKIATVTAVSPIAYSFYTPTEPYAFSVTGTSPVLNTTSVSSKSPHFGHSYTFRGTWGSGSYGVNYKWIEFAGPSMLAAGGGLKYAGNVLNVGAGAGIIINADTVQLDTAYANGIYVRLDGTYAMTGNLQLGGNKITNVGAPTVGTDASNKTYVDNQDALRVAKAGDTMSGTLTFTAGTVTGIANPVVSNDAANKVYVDNQVATRINRAGDTMTGSLVMSGAGVQITLPNAPVANTDAANKAYADTKLSLAGGTLTGNLILSGDPTVALGAATKQYVDTNYVPKNTSTALGANVSLTFSGTGEVFGLPATPTTAGSAASKAYVDTQVATRSVDSTVVHLAGVETITGAKTFSAAMVLNNQLTVAANGIATNLLITSSTVAITGTPVTSGGASTISLTAGSNTGGAGGDVTVNGGNGSTLGGNISITGGQGSAGTGGNITITSGTGTTASGQLDLVAGSASLRLVPTGAWRVGGAIPTAKSQALCSDATNPTTASPTWQLVGTRVAAAPANSAAPGVIGNWFADDNYFYVYGATGWRRMAISTF